jgi:hypothetical protein
MKYCRNTKLILISSILLISCILFRNVNEGFENSEMSAFEAAKILRDAAKASEKASIQATEAAKKAELAYTAAMERFQANSTQENGVILSNLEAQMEASKKAAEEAMIAAATADEAADSAEAALPVSSPSAPTVDADLESSAIDAANTREPLSNTTKIVIGVVAFLVLGWILYSLLFK